MTIHRRSLIAAFAALGVAGAAKAKTKSAQPVIFHTDIGGDIDDTWALLLLLRHPELDLKLVVTEGSNAVYRGRIVAKLLTLAGRSDIPIAINPDNRNDPGAQSDWLGDYKLSQYPGKLLIDAPRAISREVKASGATIISVGPATTIARPWRLIPASPRSRASSACSVPSARAMARASRPRSNITSRPI